MEVPLRNTRQAKDTLPSTRQIFWTKLWLRLPCRFSNTQHDNLENKAFLITLLGLCVARQLLLYSQPTPHHWARPHRPYTALQLPFFVSSKPLAPMGHPHLGLQAWAAHAVSLESCSCLHLQA